MTKNYLILLFSVFILNPVNAQNSMEDLLKKYNSGSVPYISVEELRMDQLNKEVLILDTRSAEEFKVSHIENAVFVNYDEFDISQVKDIPKEDNIIVYCSVGIRSENIGAKLKEAGFKNVQNLFGGIFEWKNTDFPIVDNEGNPTEKVHAYSKQWSKWLKKGEKIY